MEFKESDAFSAETARILRWGARLTHWADTIAATAAEAWHKHVTPLLEREREHDALIVELNAERTKDFACPSPPFATVAELQLAFALCADFMIPRARDPSDDGTSIECTATSSERAGRITIVVNIAINMSTDLWDLDFKRGSFEFCQQLKRDVFTHLRDQHQVVPLDFGVDAFRSESTHTEHHELVAGHFNRLIVFLADMRDATERDYEQWKKTRTTFRVVYSRECRYCQDGYVAVDRDIRIYDDDVNMYHRLTLREALDRAVMF
jgi:hypothetical protein